MIAEFSGEYRFLSNFWFVNVIYDHMTYPTVEHAYQAAKTHDLVHRQYIQTLQTPGLAKREGRKVTLREDWDDVKVLVMKNLVWQKFQRRDLKQRLLATGEQELIEGNRWHDNFWGICSCGACCLKRSYLPHDTENHLGIILMETRAKLAKGM